MNPHMKFAADLGVALARARSAAVDDSQYSKKYWDDLPEDHKDLLLELDELSNQSSLVNNDEDDESNENK